jgi:hypothetical protein
MSYLNCISSRSNKISTCSRNTVPEFMSLGA